MFGRQVVIPYVKGLSESISRIFTRFGASVARIPLRTLRNELVHSKDKVDYKEVSKCVYKISCKKCDKVYVGETARNLGIRVGEHKKEVESNNTLRFIRISKKAADEQQNKSAITDHVTRENHVTDWNGVKVVGHETDRKTRWIKEAIAIRKHKGRAIYTDTVSYFLSSIYDRLLLCDSA